MMKFKKQPLKKLCTFAFLGSAAGCINGFIFGSLIAGVIFLAGAEYISDELLALSWFLGMSIGTIIGGIFGGILGLRK